MLRWPVVFLLLGVAAGVLGFSGMAGSFAPFVQAVFLICLVLFIGLLLGRLVRGPRVPRQR